MTDPDSKARAAEFARIAQDLDKTLRRNAVAHLSAEAGQRPAARILTETKNDVGMCQFEVIADLARGKRLIRVTTEVVE